LNYAEEEFGWVSGSYMDLSTTSNPYVYLGIDETVEFGIDGAFREFYINYKEFLSSSDVRNVMNTIQSF
jgi:hypothetical protein